jgi:hypothetical protein
MANDPLEENTTELAGPVKVIGGCSASRDE